MEPEKIKVWITKYALTSGIQCVEASHSHAQPDMVFYGEGYVSQYARGRDWHSIPDQAIRRAEEMRDKKIASLRKQLKRLEAMTFEVEDGNR